MSASPAGSPAVSGGRAGTGPTLSIGEVLAQLRPEFSDISISKIRYLETEGLVEPERAPSGYRRFRQADVERLRYVLRAQRDHYWPLRVIKDALDAMDRGLQPPAPLGRPGVPTAVPDLGPDGLPSPDAFRRHRSREADGLRLTRTELAEALGQEGGPGDRPDATELLDALEAHGLLTARPDGHFDEDALAVARAAGRLAAYGLEPRHLRASRTAADREVGLISQVVATTARSRTPDGRGRAEEAARDLAAQLVGLHAVLVRAGLRRLS